MIKNGIPGLPDDPEIMKIVEITETRKNKFWQFDSNTFDAYLHKVLQFIARFDARVI